MPVSPISNILRALSTMSAALAAFALLFSTIAPSPPIAAPASTASPAAVVDSMAPPASTPAVSSAMVGNTLVATCDESLYPTPTPPPDAQSGVKSPDGTYGDRFSTAEVQLMPSEPSAFDASGKLLADAAAPVLPPPPPRQFAALDTPTPDPSGAAASDATPTVVPTYMPAKPKRVVLQAGHWLRSEMPYQISQFSDDGAYSGGVAEWVLNLHVASLAADLLRARGYDVRVVPATVPVGCQADAFVAIHADADSDTSALGYKAAYPRYINNPANRRLLADMYIEYGAATGFTRNPTITLNMSGYYAFDNQKQPYAVDPSTPMIILEMGYISNDYERQYLATNQSIAAQGIANGVDRFLQGK